MKGKQSQAFDYRSNIKHIRTSLDISQREMGCIMGLKESNYQSIELGRSSLTTEGLKAISTFSGISMNEIIEAEFQNKYPAIKILKNTIKRVVSECVHK